jgi:hypothetical protein
MFLVGCLAAVPVQAQNLEAGKSPSQIFAGTCSLCHKTSRGLLKTVPPGSLPGFLREHYTTSSDMASLLSAFLISNGATNTRYGGTQPADAKPETKPAGVSEQLDWQGRKLPGTSPRQDAAKPDDDGSSPLVPRQGRNAKRPVAPGEVPDTANLSEHDPDGRKPAGKQKLGKRSKPGGEESPKIDDAKTDAAKSEPSKEEPSKGEMVKDDQRKSDPAKDEDAKTESAKLPGEGKSDSAKIDVPKDAGSSGAPAMRTDPVPPATPAPASSGTTGPAEAVSPPAPPAAVTASAPQPPPPAAPAGPPVPPISQ